MALRKVGNIYNKSTNEDQQERYTQRNPFHYERNILAKQADMKFPSKQKEKQAKQPLLRKVGNVAKGMIADNRGFSDDDIKAFRDARKYQTSFEGKKVKITRKPQTWEDTKKDAVATAKTGAELFSLLNKGASYAGEFIHNQASKNPLNPLRKLNKIQAEQFRKARDNSVIDKIDEFAKPRDAEEAERMQFADQLSFVAGPTKQGAKLSLNKATKHLAKAKSQYIKTTPKKAPIFRKEHKEIITATDDSALKRGAEKLLTPISSRLERIDPSLKKTMRQFEFNAMNNALKDSKGALPMLKAQKSLSKEDRVIFDFARKNGDADTINAVATKYGFTKELEITHKILDDIHKRAKEVGMDIGYRENYFPRIVKDPKGLLNYLNKTEDWSDIQKLIKDKAEKMGVHYTDLTDADKASIINSYVRGYGDNITLSDPGATKLRSIKAVDHNIDQFYEKTDAALVDYIHRMNDEIEARKFFGKKLGVDGERVNIEDSIGSYVLDLLAKGKITPAQEREVTDILKARFNRGKMNGALDVYRNLEYISTMGNPISAITQIGDLAWTFYDNGIFHSLKNLGKSTVGRAKNRVTREDLGIERITQEFSSQSKSAKALETVFKVVGLDKMDRIGKETLVNASLSKMSAMAKKNNPALIKELKKTFDTDEAKLAFKDLQKGEVTERTKLVLFNKLADFQPVTKSEMPQKYLEMPNGRIFYMLKSFTLKQIDVFRREAIDDLVSGDKKKAAKGMKNLVLLGGWFMFANATADEVKDMVLGRETSLRDRVVDNLWRTMGASKFDIYKARQDGVGQTAVKKILFPTSLFDRATKDVTNMGSGKEYEKGPLKGDKYKSELVQSVPILGKPYYWWFGRGQQKQDYKTGNKPSGKTVKNKKIKKTNIKKPKIKKVKVKKVTPK